MLFSSTFVSLIILKLFNYVLLSSPLYVSSFFSSQRNSSTKLLVNVGRLSSLWSYSWYALFFYYIRFSFAPFQVFFSILLNWFADQAGFEYSLERVGQVNGGFPKPRLPSFKFMPQVIGSSLTIAIIGFVIHIAMAKLVSKKLNYAIDPNQVSFKFGINNN